jgi:hypothetical protein
MKIVLSRYAIEKNATARPAGYVEDVLQNAESIDGDQVTFSETAFSALRDKYAPRGPGAELSTLLKRFGIEPSPTCSCRAKAAEMDAWGCDEASRPERIEEVVGVMRAEAEARGLPFVDMAGRMLVRRAIANARKAEAKRAREAERPPLHTEQ